MELLCVIVVAIIIIWIAVKASGGNNNYRNSCGECRYRTTWSTQSQAERDIVEHYRNSHPDIDPGGRQHYRGR
ncbi:hypothetical protein [Haloglycomyces albus]|uniref:hypothetical protein n=1 Tax=Haloglycomyces albus TaxID=526067 RepID=UPI0004BC40F6|nr:hypothetical protein [Haloglycomyces albus]